MAAAKKRASGASGSTDPFWDQVEWLFNFGENGLTELKNGYSITLNDNAEVISGALQCDPTNDYLRVDGISPIDTQPFVIETFMELATSWTDGTIYYPYIFATQPSQNNAGVVVYLMSGSIHTAGGGVAQGGSVAGKQANTIYHIALVRDASNNVSLYVDGGRVASPVINGTSHSNTSHWIGGNVESQGATRTSSKRFYSARCTIGTDRGYTGSTIEVPSFPFPDSTS